MRSYTEAPEDGLLFFTGINIIVWIVVRRQQTMLGYTCKIHSLLITVHTQADETAGPKRTTISRWNKVYL